MLNKIEKKDVTYDIKNIFKIYLIICIPIIIVITLYINHITSVEIEAMKNLIRTEQKSKMETAKYIINSNINDIIEDIKVIKDSKELDNYIKTNNYENQLILSRLFLRVGDNKKGIDNIVYLDNLGNEIIRVYKRDEKTYFTSNKDLENKKNKNYFIKSTNLEKNQIYISNIEVETEKDYLLIPAIPIIKLATPVVNKDGKMQGILVVNYLGSEILNVFKKYSLNDNFMKTYLVNKDGYYMTGEEDKIFGFLIGEEGENLKTENPILWNKILNSKEIESFFSIEDINYSVFKLELTDKNENIVKDSDGYIISSFSIKSMPDIMGLNVDNINFYTTIVLGVVLLFFTSFYYFSIKHRKSFNIIELVAENTKDALFIINSQHKIIYGNKAFKSLAGFKEKEDVNIDSRLLNFLKEGKDFYKNIAAKLKKEGIWKGKTWIRRRDGVITVPDLILIGEKEENNNKIKTVIGIAREANKKSNQSKLDRYFENSNYYLLSERESEFEELINKNIKEKGSFSLVYLYIKNRKVIESTYDEEEYDYLINKIEKRISIIIGEENFLYKLSEDEYMFELIGIGDKKEIGDFMENFFYQISQPISNTNVLFDIKCGIARYPIDGSMGRDLIINSQIAYGILDDDSFYYQIYDKTSEDKLFQENQINQKIKFAVKNKELKVKFQPQVNSKTEKVVGGEVLLRWDNKELGTISPQLFIPKAEKNGSIIEIGNFVIEEAFKLLKEITEKYNKSIPISINISPEQFKYKGLVEYFITMKDKYQVNLKNIKIEITEGMLIGNKKEINKKLKIFKELGMRVSIDDFGTGFSSLAYLRFLEVDELKIDREFIKNIPEFDDGTIALVIVDLGKRLKKQVIAEGVETSEQIEFLKSIGCYTIQGYYYSKPLDKDSFIKFVR